LPKTTSTTHVYENQKQRQVEEIIYIYTRKVKNKKVKYYMRKIHERKNTRKGLRNMLQRMLPWASDDLAKEQLEKLTIHW